MHYLFGSDCPYHKPDLLMTWMFCGDDYQIPSCWLSVMWSVVASHHLHAPLRAGSVVMRIMKLVLVLTCAGEVSLYYLYEYQEARIIN